MENLAHLKKRFAVEKRKRGVFLCRRTARIKVKGNIASTSFWKMVGRRRSLGWKSGERGQLVKLGGNQNKSSEAHTNSKRGPQWKEQRRCQEKSDEEGWGCHSH